MRLDSALRKVVPNIFRPKKSRDNKMTFITHGFRVSVVSDVRERVRDFRIAFALYVKKIFISCVSVLHRTGVYKASIFFSSSVCSAKGTAARLNETRFGPKKKSSPIYLGPKNLDTSFALYVKKIFISCVSVLHRTGVYKASIFFSSSVCSAMFVKKS
jgi:hypothetical protein